MTDSLPMTVTAPLSEAQRTQLLTLVRRAARAEIMPRFRQLSAEQIAQKSGPQDLVTDADRLAEAMLTRGLLAMFPHALIVGEEHASENPAIIDKIAEAELCFTIDPVDGTWNFANGLPLFGVMISILRFGTPVLGLLYDPVMNDVVVADSENRTRHIMPRRVRRPATTSKGGPVEELQGYVPLYLLPEDKQGTMAACYPRFSRIGTLRCACHEFRMLALGHVDFVLQAKLTPWDQPAGVVCTRQAGGHAAMLDGSPYRGDLREGYLLAASDAATWGRVRDAFDFLLDRPESEPPDAAEDPSPAADADNG